MQKNSNCDYHIYKACGSPNRFSQYPNFTTNIKKSLVLSKICSNFKNEVNKKISCQKLLMNRLKRCSEETNKPEYPRCLTNISDGQRKDTEANTFYDKCQNMQLMCPSLHDEMDPSYDSCLKEFKKMKNDKIAESLKKCYLIMKMKDDMENLILDVLPSAYLKMQLSMRRNNRMEQVPKNTKTTPNIKARLEMEEEPSCETIKKYLKNSRENKKSLANCIMPNDLSKNTNTTIRKDFSSEKSETSYPGIVDIFVFMWQCITGVVSHIMAVVMNYDKVENSSYDGTKNLWTEECSSRKSEKIYSDNALENATNHEISSLIKKLKKEKCLLLKELENERLVNQRIVDEILNHLNESEEKHVDKTAKMKPENTFIKKHEKAQYDEHKSNFNMGVKSNKSIIDLLIQDKSMDILSEYEIKRVSSESFYRQKVSSLKEQIKLNGTTDYKSFEKSSFKNDKNILKNNELTVGKGSFGHSVNLTKVNLARAESEVLFSNLLNQINVEKEDNRPKNNLAYDSLEKKHKKKSPRTKSPKAKSPRTKSPRTKSPRTKSPGTKSPKAKSPRTKSPKTKSSKKKSPKTKSPRTKSPKKKIKEKSDRSHKESDESDITKNVMDNVNNFKNPKLSEDISNIDEHFNNSKFLEDSSNKKESFKNSVLSKEPSSNDDSFASFMPPEDTTVPDDTIPFDSKH